MCIIIDTNTLASVFDPTTARHIHFKPVLDWVYQGNGKVVYGGSRYLTEIQKYLGVFNELKKKNKAIKIDDGEVDMKEVEVSKMIKHPDFDDQHLVALLIVSKIKLICSQDERAFKYFKNALFFKRANQRPRIFKGTPQNVDLLTEANITQICKPCQKPH